MYKPIVIDYKCVCGVCSVPRRVVQALWNASDNSAGCYVYLSNGDHKNLFNKQMKA